MNLSRVMSIMLAFCISTSALRAQARPLDPKDAQLPKVQMPEEFALVFSFGYVNDFMPKTAEKFEEMLKNMKRTGINAVHCKYADWRLKLCEKHGIMMLVDLTVPEHDVKLAKCSIDDALDLENLDGADERFLAVKSELDKINARVKDIDKQLKPGKDAKPPEAERATELEKEKKALEAQRPALEQRRAVLIASNVKYICKQSRGSKGVWGYGVWYDNGTNGAFLNHAIEKVRTWDPTHPSYVGSYRHGGLETVTINPGCYGWYDFHWTRGILWHYLDMKVVNDICNRRNAIMGNYAQYAGLKQDLFTLNQSIAAGNKMTLWFIGGPMSRDTHEWNDNQDLVRIAAEVRHTYKELMRIGNPTAYYSTPVTKTHDNKPLDKAAIPRWFSGVPADFWMQVSSGEAMIGVFQYSDKTDALFVANHNAFAPQQMKLQFKGTPRVSMFDRKQGGWTALEAVDGAVSFTLDDGRGELLKIEKSRDSPFAK